MGFQKLEYKGKKSWEKQTMLTGTTVGLLGGSFDPPHSGHVHITNQAFQAFGLHRIWWLVSPQNPLKDKKPSSLALRVNKCKNIVQHPKVFVSDIEGRLNTHVTAQTLRKLYLLYPGVRFVWLMGADNLSNFHNWEEWTWIMENIPIGIMARPGEQVKAGLSQTALRYRRFRVKSYNAAALPFMRAPAWSLLGGPVKDISSTKIRSEGLG